MHDFENRREIALTNAIDSIGATDHSPTLATDEGRATEHRADAVPVDRFPSTRVQALPD